MNDLKLVVNPSTGGLATEIPITFDYSWEVLKYFNSFSFDSFDNSVNSIFGILFDLAGITKEELLNELLITFFEDYNALTLFVSQFNIDNGTSMVLDASQSESSQMRNVLNTIDAGDLDFVEYIITKYVDQGSFEEGFENLQALLGRWYGNITSTDISEILKIKFRFSMPNVSLGLLFPRKWLKPLDDNYNSLPEPAQSGLVFNAGALEYSTESGFQFVKENSFDLTRSEIANTRIIIEFNGLKVDLSNDSNIPEAIADGRADNFKGVYAQLAAITLPKNWFDNEDNHPGTTARIAGYDILVGTGGLSGTIALETLALPDDSIYDYYSDSFSFQYPISITSDDVSETIDTYGDLILYFNSLNGESYTFDFPLNVVTKDNIHETIENQEDYSAFLGSFVPADTPPVRLIKKIGGNGFEVWFNSFDITFKQNKIIESTIIGGLKIPRLKDANGDIAEIDIFGHFDDTGDFLVSASEKDGLQPIGIPGIIQFYIQKVELGKEGDDFFIGCACEIDFPSPLMNTLLEGQRIHIESMRFYSNGSFEIISGTIPVPANFTINLGPVEISITNMSLSSYQEDGRKFMAFGFDGAIDLGSLGLEARGKGMQYYFTVDSGEFHSEFRIQTIEADLIIPGNATEATAKAIIKGYLSVPQPGESKEYSGGVSVNLPQINVAGSAEIRLQPRYPAFIVDASVEIPKPIPIVGPVSISGFRGLIGFRYIAEKEAVGLKSGEDSWYDYYKYPKQGVNVQKFSGPDKSEDAKSGFSIGAGATLVTADGQTLSARLMFILSLPNTIIFDGKANLLSEALDLDDSGEPPFFAFVALGDSSLELGAGVDFKNPADSGELIDMKVSMEAYFPFRNSSAWYIHLGSKRKPNEARVFDLIDMSAYLELSAKGMAMGARADFDFNKKFGPARVKAWLYAEVGGNISFERPQIGGYVVAGGGAEVKFWIISVGVEVKATFGAEIPKPFKLQASVYAKGSIKIGFVKVKKSITVDVKWERSKKVDTTPIKPLPNSYVDQNVKGISMLTGEAFNLHRITSRAGNAPSSSFPVLPMDTYVDIKFQKPINPNNVRNQIGGASSRASKSIELIPPEASVRGKNFRQVAHEYNIDEINIDIWNGTSWVAYNPYKAITHDNNVNVDNFKFGHWQKSGSEYNAIRILGDTPFSYLQHGQPGWVIPEQIGITSSSLFCELPFDYKRRAHWEKTVVGKRYPLIEIDPNADFESETLIDIERYYTHNELSFTIISNQTVLGGNRSAVNYAEVAKAYAPNFNYSRGLQFNNDNPLIIKYKNPSRQACFKMVTGAVGVTFIFYKTVFEPDDLKVTFVEFDSVYKTAAELDNEFSYESKDEGNTVNTISQVKIIPLLADNSAIARIRDEIATLEDTILDIEIENIDEVSSTLTTQLNILISQLTTLESEMCKIVEIPCLGIGDMEVNDDFMVGKGDNGIGVVTQTICETVLFEAAWLTEYDYKIEKTAPSQAEITADFELGTAAITNVVEPIWRPDAQYRVHFKLSDTVQGEVNTWDYYYGFATSGPVGHYPGPNVNLGSYNKSSFEVNLSQEEKDKYAHATLRQYIDYKRSYPNANGNLLNSKPLFYGTTGGNNTISVFYLKAYAYHMLRNWPAYTDISADEIENVFEILVKDPVEDITLSNPPKTDYEITKIPGTQIEWNEETNPLFPFAHRTYNNLAQSNDNCAGSPSKVLIPKRYVTDITVNNMKPQKMYTAIINSVYTKPETSTKTTKEIHNFVFQTSRYLNFQEQINSYLLKTDSESLVDEVVNKAVFSVEVNISNENLNTAYNIVNGKGLTDNNSLALQGEKLDLFDRVTEGLFGMTPLDPAATTEFNVIKNTETGDVIAMLIRNPEPFNDPKIDLEIIDGAKNKNNQGFAVLSGTTVDTDYKILYAKDYSQILVMYKNNNQVAITAESLAMRFNYLLWNGDKYNRQSAVTVTDILTNTKG